MSHIVFVERLTPDGEVIDRTRCTQLPIRIGRAYDNDIILDDQHTAAHHALIELNQLDELVITDLESQNGISLGKQRSDYFVVNGDATYRLGHTRLRIRTADYVVAAEVSDSTNYHWEGWLPAVLGGSLLVFVALLDTWLRDLQQGTVSKYLLELVGTFGFALGWAGVWALFSALRSPLVYRVCGSRDGGILGVFQRGHRLRLQLGMAGALYQSTHYPDVCHGALLPPADRRHQASDALTHLSGCVGAGGNGHQHGQGIPDEQLSVRRAVSEQTLSACAAAYR
jgi:hypothetical protein